MKTSLIAVGLCAVLMGCGSSPSPSDGKTSPAGDPSYNYDTPGEPYVGPCDKPSFQAIMVNGRLVEVEVPTLCNQGGDPYHGDPCPDCSVDPAPERNQGDPWDKQTPPSTKEHVNPESVAGRQQRSNR